MTLVEGQDIITLDKDADDETIFLELTKVDGLPKVTWAIEWKEEKSSIPDLKPDTIAIVADVPIQNTGAVEMERSDKTRFLVGTPNAGHKIIILLNTAKWTKVSGSLRIGRISVKK